MITDDEKLLFALWQTENIMELTKDNEWKIYLHKHLNTVKWELKRQMNLKK